MHNLKNNSRLPEIDSTGYKSALDSLYCSAVIMDRDGDVLYHNRSAQKLLSDCGIPVTEFVEELKKQIHPAYGQGRFLFSIHGVQIVCNVYPWVTHGERMGSTLILHKRMHNGCSMPEMSHIADSLSEMNAVLEVSYDGMMITDGQGDILQVNHATEKVLNRKRRELLGRNVEMLTAQGILDHSAVIEVIKTKKPISLMVRTDSDKKLLISAVPVLDEEGSIRSVMVNLRDMSELYELQKKLEQQKTMTEAYQRELVRMSSHKPAGMVAASREMQNLLETIGAIAQIDSTVLITGESGVGKEVIVNQIYTTSSRNHMPIIKINCGAIPDSLFESEMFGYEEGSFTGARKKGKAGFFEMANGGTLFLDEIGELRADLQVKLLRVIQEGELMRVGGTKLVKIDVRIIAATNRDLWEAVKNGSFRQDLYYRLNVIGLEIPPLRKRRDDILPLAVHFVKKYNEKYHQSKVLGFELGQVLRGMDWPGNIRELENLIENLVVLVQDSDLLQPAHMPERYQKDNNTENEVFVRGIMPMKEAVAQAERQLLLNAKQQYKTTREIARAVAVNQSTVSRKLQIYFKDVMH